MTKQPGPSAFDCYADAYDATVQAAIGASGESVAWFADLKARLARAEASHDTRRILDFGCGVGNASRALAAAFPEARVTGSDPSAESIASARSRSGPGIEYVQVRGPQLPFSDGCFDLVVAACVFHHIAEAEQRVWIAEVARVLRRGGRFALFEHNPLNPLTRQVVRRVPFDRGVTLVGRGRARHLLRDAGLREMRSRYYFFFPRALAAMRRAERFMGWIPFGGQYYVVGEKT